MAGYVCFRCLAALPQPGVLCRQCGYVPERSAYPEALLNGSVLENRYVAGPVLGRGGFGITYFARHINLQGYVAIKEFYPSWIALRRMAAGAVTVCEERGRPLFMQGLNHFLNEARYAQRIQHTNLVDVRDFFQSNNTAYLVMEYLEGKTLSDYVGDHGGRLPAGEALAIMRPVLDAVQAIHAQGMAHRDIKPGNILITTSGRPVLLDFGSAREVTQDQVQTRALVVSDGYSAPELYAQGARQGQRSDIYSCAATLYRLVAGQCPVKADYRVYEMRAQGRPDPLLPPGKAAGVSINRCLEKAVLRGMTLEYDQRPASIEQFKGSLRWGFSSPDLHELRKLLESGMKLTRDVLWRVRKQQRLWVSRSSKPQAALSQSHVLSNGLLFGLLGGLIMALLVCLVFLFRFIG